MVRLTPGSAAEIVRQAHQSQIIFIAGETGCGKSSGVPQALREDSLARQEPDECILISQPRRLAAVAVATRVASERGVPIGDEVGFSIGGQHCAGEKTRLLFVTAGVLLERLRTQVHSHTRARAHPHTHTHIHHARVHAHAET